MTLHLANHRTASLRILSRWDFGCRKFRTCYIVQFGPVWLSIDRKASVRRSNDKLSDASDAFAPASG